MKKHCKNPEICTEKKYPCPDCNFCQFCSETRCNACRQQTPRTPKMSIAEQIALFESINGPYRCPDEPIYYKKCIKKDKQDV